MVDLGSLGSGLDEATNFAFDPVGTLTSFPGLFDGIDAVRAVLDRVQLPGDPPRTSIRTSHGALLWARVGTRRGIIGAVTRMQFEQSVDLEEVYEIQPNTNGCPVDIIVQNLKGRQITVDLFETNRTLFEAVFGTPDLTLLSNQNVQLALREMERRPGGRLVHTYQYDGVRIRNWGRQMNADDDRIVRCNATFVWQGRKPLL